MTDLKGRVLIVDDNKVNRLLLIRNVELLGHTASVAEDGKVALAMLEEAEFDVLLLDIEMPEAVDRSDIVMPKNRRRSLTCIPPKVKSCGSFGSASPASGITAPGFVICVRSLKLPTRFNRMVVQFLQTCEG